MDRRRRVRTSKLVSLLLRHDPDRAGLTLDPGGWVGRDELLEGLAALGHPTTPEEFEEVISGGDVPRFEIRGGRVRARYGHSIPVELQRGPSPPPELLFHGTSDRRVERILREGVRPMGRQMVHLSSDRRSARQVGARHGEPAVLVIEAARLAQEAGTRFYRLPGGVWLVDEVVPAGFIRR
jgi:putative RNA 2'-phosphotransferase